MAKASNSTRWNLRVAPDANSLVRRAASVTHRDLTTFVVEAAVGEADRVLADRTRYALDEARWAEFVDLLERPVRENHGLKKLFAKPPVFE